MRKTLAPLLALTLVTPLFAQTVVEESPPPDQAAKVAEMTAAAAAGGLGPFPAEMIADPALPTHTLYRPRDLSAAARRGRLPIVAWANGACANYGNRFRYFLTEIASQGYLVLAIGPIGPSTVEWKISLDANNPLPPSERLSPSFAQQMTDAIDWAIAENGRRGSPYYHRLDTRAIAVMGQSCGGLQAISAAADPRVSTAVVLNSGTFAEGRRPLMGTADANKASLRRIHVPTAWISGDESDQAFPNANADYAAFTTAPALRMWHEGTGHSTHYREPHGGLFTPVIVTWLAWHLKHDQRAASFLLNEQEYEGDCAYCRADGWHIETKGF